MRSLLSTDALDKYQDVETLKLVMYQLQTVSGRLRAVAQNSFSFQPCMNDFLWVAAVALETNVPLSSQGYQVRHPCRIGGQIAGKMIYNWGAGGGLHEPGRGHIP